MMQKLKHQFDLEMQIIKKGSPDERTILTRAFEEGVSNKISCDCQQYIQKQSYDVFFKKGVLGNFAKFTGKQLCHRLFFDKVAGLRQTFDIVTQLTQFQTFSFMKNRRSQRGIQDTVEHQRSLSLSKHLCQSCYTSPSRLFIIGGTEIKCSEGKTQGDPVAMPIYVLSVIPLMLMVLEITDTKQTLTLKW